MQKSQLLPIDKNFKFIPSRQIISSLTDSRALKSNIHSIIFNDLLFGVDSKLFACSKSELHCLHLMLPLRVVVVR